MQFGPQQTMPGKNDLKSLAQKMLPMVYTWLLSMTSMQALELRAPECN